MTVAEELIQKGRAEGRVEGRAEGRVKARAELVLELLTHKFGEVPDEYVATIESASAEQLDRYAKRMVTEDTLAKVFTAD